MNLCICKQEHSQEFLSRGGGPKCTMHFRPGQTQNHINRVWEWVPTSSELSRQIYGNLTGHCGRGWGGRSGCLDLLWRSWPGATPLLVNLALFGATVQHTLARRAAREQVR